MPVARRITEMQDYRSNDGRDPLAANAVVGVWSTASRQAVRVLRGIEGKGDDDQADSSDGPVSNTGQYL